MKTKNQPFRHARNATPVLGRVSYYHPTKGWRFRAPTSALVGSLWLAGKLG